MKRKKSGSTLVVAVSAIALIAVLVGASLTLSTQTSRDQQRGAGFLRALAVGSGALDMAFADWRSQILGAAIPRRPIAQPTLANISTTEFPGLQTGNATENKFLITNYLVQGVSPLLGALAGNVTYANYPYGASSGGAQTYYYKASADVSIPAVNGKPVTAKVRRVFEQQIESPWQYAIFYDSDLEMHPGPAQYIGGRVHTNRRLFAAHAQLTYGDRVTYVDTFVNDYKSGDKERRNGEAVATPTFPDGMSPASSERRDPFGFDPGTKINTTDTGNGSANNDGYRELIERPATGTDAFEDYRFYYQAGIKIIIDNSGRNGDRATKIYKKTGNKTMSLVTGSSTGSDRDLFNAVNPAISIGETLQDNREGASVKLVRVDIGTLTDNVGDISTWNGMVYVSDTTADQTGGSTNKRAIQLHNGRELPDTGLTVASDNAIYVVGDYNTGGSNGSDVPTNLGSSADARDASPEASGYDRVPAAVIGDAVMILSNGWQNSDGGLPLNNADRKASNTTVNAGILAGNVETTANPNTYSGGSENFPRFLEKWGGDRRLSYFGSMLQLWQSKQYIGIWGQSNVYDPPERNWFFEQMFRTDPPPGDFFVIVTLAKGRWFVE